MFKHKIFRLTYLYKALVASTVEKVSKMYSSLKHHVDMKYNIYSRECLLNSNIFGYEEHNKE